jgi:hypothetical protein
MLSMSRPLAEVDGRKQATGFGYIGAIAAMHELPRFIAQEPAAGTGRGC